MVTKAIILGKVVGTNKYSVRIPYFESAGEYPSIFEATLSTQPSLSEEYKEGDVVFVTFEDKQVEKIVIIGSLSTLGNDEPRGYAHLQDLKVEGSANLPLETSIGGYSLKNLPQFIENINIPSSSKIVPTLVTQGTFDSNGEFNIHASQVTLEEGLYFFTYSQAQTFGWITSTMLLNTLLDNPIRLPIAVIYNNEGSAQPGFVRLQLTSSTNLKVKVANESKHAYQGLVMKIYKAL